MVVMYHRFTVVILGFYGCSNRGSPAAQQVRPCSALDADSKPHIVAEHARVKPAAHASDLGAKVPACGGQRQQASANTMLCVRGDALCVMHLPPLPGPHTTAVPEQADVRGLWL